MLSLTVSQWCRINKKIILNNVTNVAFKSYRCLGVFSQSCAYESGTSQIAVNKEASTAVQPKKCQLPIADFYAGKSVFITGVTGFVAKVCVEKLLYSCKDIDKVFVLVRNKKDENIAKRMEKIINSPVFSRLKADRPQDMNKIIPVAGDIQKPGLGISDEDQERLIDKVSVVFHVAASVDFEEELVSSLNTNLIGTVNTLSLSRRMKNIEAFVHVSTAYCNTHVDVMEEKVYPPPAQLDEVLKCLEAPKLNGNRLNKLYRDRPNTYTYAKALAENYVAENHGDLPAVIVRPSIVVSSAKEPIPGWSDTIQGATALVSTSWKGLNRVIMGQGHHVVDLIPVDYVSNLLIVAAARCQSSSDVTVHNCCTSSTKPLTLEMMLKFVQKREADNVYSIMYPRVIFTKSKTLLSILTVLLQTGPAYAGDLFRRLKGKRPMYMKIQSKILAAHGSLNYFTYNSWIFKTDSTGQLHKSLSYSDRKEFPFNPSDIDWDKYFETFLNGIERFLLTPRKRT